MFTETSIDLIRHGEPVGGQKLRGVFWVCQKNIYEI